MRLIRAQWPVVSFLFLRAPPGAGFVAFHHGDRLQLADFAQLVLGVKQSRRRRVPGVHCLPGHVGDLVELLGADVATAQAADETGEHRRGSRLPVEGRSEFRMQYAALAHGEVLVDDVPPLFPASRLRQCLGRKRPQQPWSSRPTRWPASRRRSTASRALVAKDPII